MEGSIGSIKRYLLFAISHAVDYAFGYDEAGEHPWGRPQVLYGHSGKTVRLALFAISQAVGYDFGNLFTHIAQPKLAPDTAGKGQAFIS